VNRLAKFRGVTLSGLCAVLTATGCAFQGVNSLPLPGAVGRGPGASIYHIQIANVGRLESNSPVMIDDVVVGSVGNMTVNGWHADVDVSIKPDVVVPGNAVATVGQTSLLGSVHLELNPPLGEPPRGRLAPGTTIPLSKSSTFPSTEQTLAMLSVVVNSGGLGQIGDIIHNLNAAFSGREAKIRDLLTQLDMFVGTLDRQHDNIVRSIQALNRLAGTFADQRTVITETLEKLPPALEVLIKERPRITEALTKLRQFGDLATGLINDTQADLVRNLNNLEPTIRKLADVGPDLDTAIAYALTPYPYSQNLIDRGVKGDYLNLYAAVDFTIPRLKRTLFLGTRWGQLHAPLVPAPGEPFYLEYTYDPLSVGVATPPATPAPAVAAPPPPNAGDAPVGAVPALAPTDTGDR
jgi:phospholipid/cholesterol/gamma-HCH transport system substrate-binding protein